MQSVWLEWQGAERLVEWQGAERLVEWQGAERLVGRAGCRAFCRKDWKDREDPIRWREAGTGFYLKIYYIAGRFCNGT